MPKAVELQKGGELLVRLNDVDAQIKAADVIRATRSAATTSSR